MRPTNVGMTDTATPGLTSLYVAREARTTLAGLLQHSSTVTQLILPRAGSGAVSK